MGFATRGLHARTAVVAALALCLLASSLTPAGAIGAANVLTVTKRGAGDGTVSTAPVGDISTFIDERAQRVFEIAAGSDGAMWFTAPTSPYGIVRISAAGEFTSFPGDEPGDIEFPLAIAPGPDSALWFTDGGRHSIGRLTTAGVLTTFDNEGSNYVINGPAGITSGPDGALWFTNEGSNTIGRITTAGAITTFSDATIDTPGSITTGPDGALWFVNRSAPASIGRITTDGVVSNFTDSGLEWASDITAGPDGAVWFTGNVVGRITADAPMTLFNTGEQTQGIATGPDGNLWFAGEHNLGSITPQGEITLYSAEYTGPRGIAAGSDGAMWFGARTVGGIGRIQAAGGIDCGDDCTESYGDATVTLTATPAHNSTFDGWSGACTNVTGTCAVTMDEAKTVNAIFGAVPQTCVATNDAQNVIVGTEGDDLLVGTSGADVICGRGGRDIIRGFGGADILDGNGGADSLRGGRDRDHLIGGSGDDLLRGGGDNDRLHGLAGKDTLRGRLGNDTLAGGENADVLFGGAGNDRVSGNGGNDDLAGGADVDDCLGGAGVDAYSRCETKSAAQ